MGSNLQSALKTEQAIHVSYDAQAPPGVLFAENIEDADYDDDDAESDNDEDSSDGDLNSDSDGEDKDTNDGSGNDTPPPDLQRRSQRCHADRRQWETRFINDRYTYMEPTTGPQY